MIEKKITSLSESLTEIEMTLSTLMRKDTDIDISDIRATVAALEQRLEDFDKEQREEDKLQN